MKVEYFFPFFLNSFDQAGKEMLSLLRNCVVALTQGGRRGREYIGKWNWTVSISHLLYALPSLYSLYLLQWAFPRRSTYTRCSTKDKDQLISPLMFDLNAYLSRGTGNKIPSTAFVIATVGKFILYFFRHNCKHLTNSREAIVSFTIWIGWILFPLYSMLSIPEWTEGKEKSIPTKVFQRLHLFTIFFFLGERNNTR